jgi:anti-sigma factor RsiW
MRCTKARKHISEYIDGDLDSKKRAKLEKHLDECTGCQELLQDFQDMALEARGLKQPTPPDSVWNKIQAQMEKGQQTVYYPAPKRRNWLTLPQFQYAVAAAALVLVVVAAVTLGPGLFKKEAALTGMEKQQYSLAKLEEAEKHYQEAIKALSEALAIQEKQFDPKLAEVFKINLEIVNVTISACKQAVRDDPGDFDSRKYLLTAYQEKADLLNRMMNLNGDSFPQRELGKTL